MYSILFLSGAVVARQKVEAFMRSLRICGVMIYFMARGERLTKRQVFGNQGNPVYAIWPVGKKWCASIHTGKEWKSLTYVPVKTEWGAYDRVMEHFYQNS
ncbi:hypothetical protein [Ewingella americana]|uniref:hypothetical protein n=1 Tax=Ewingella americana TaxID=41202 RepID=UPI0012AE6E54|nr:hypothetical protein [Ewingella americana]MRT04069.1 hypothetical protein [Ewingella americana]